MKKVIIILIGLGLSLTAFISYALSDRDTGMWLLNTAVRIANPHDSTTGVSYGSKPWQKLDVYPQDNAAPVVIFVNGGSWRHGRPDQYRFVADAFIRKGYTVVLPNYIKYPDENARYPQFVEDIAQATAWVKNNITDYNGLANKLFLVGHSAGAHTVVMLAADGQYLKNVGLSEKDIRGVVGIAGPYSFVPDWHVTKTVFGPADRYPLMDALNYIDGAEPNMLLLHSEGDAQVGQYNQEKLAASLNNIGVQAETKLYKALSHIDMVTSLHPWLQKGIDVTADIDAFIKSQLIVTNKQTDSVIMVTSIK